MKTTKTILFGVLFLSAFAFASCGSRPAKEVEKKECCEKKDSSSCCAKKDSTTCEKKCEHAKDSTKTE